MKAMIFAAGLGTRLEPFTRHAPKALIPVGGKPMLQRVAEKLAGAGVTTIVINVHHHPEKIREFIGGLNMPGIRFIISDETGLLLDTGGGLKKASSLLAGSEAVFLYNADVLCDIDLRQMLHHHLSKRAMATLAVSDRSSSRYFLWDENGQLGGWRNDGTGESILCEGRPDHSLQALAFSGVHIINPELTGLIREAGVFSINDVYLRLAAIHPVIYFRHDERYWADIGTPEKLQRAREMFEKNPERFGGD
jgi:N-acetyl-alpha-D-muramate 1-phosphate uridylyltransferase